MSDFVRRAVVSLVLPCALLVAFPIAAVLWPDTKAIAWLREAPLSTIANVIGLLLIVLGLALLFSTIPLFLRLSEGTIMPWEPPTELIVEGVYRYVRNPMHTGVFAVLLGEGLVLRSVSILTFAAFAVLVHVFYIPLSEERGLERRFGEAYRTYKRNVPRWLPRSTPWEPDGE